MAYPYVKKALAYQPSPFLGSGKSYRGSPGSFHRFPANKRKRTAGSGGSRKRFKGRKGHKVSRRFAEKVALGLAAPNFYVWNQGTRAAANPGTQLWLAPGAMDAAHFSPFCGAYDLASIGVNLDGNWRSYNQQFFLESAQQIVDVTNQGNAPVILERYNIVLRKDLPVNLLGASISADTFQTFMAAVYTRDKGTGGTGGLSSNIVGLDLYQYPTFTEYFKVLSKKRIQLGPGEVQTFTLHKRNVRRIKSTYEGDDTDLIGAKGLGMFTVFGARGAPSNDSTTKTSATTTSNSLALDFVTSRRYTYTWIQDINNDMYGVNNLPNTFAINASIMNEDTGAATTGFAPA